MKIVEVEAESVTIIYPFVRPDSDPVFNSAKITIWPDGMIRFDRVDLMTVEAAKMLAEALLHAVKIAEKGLK